MSNIKMIILDKVIEEIDAQIRNSERGRQSAMEDAKSHKGAMQSRYDTFKEEAQYLAAGYALQMADLGKQLSSLKNLRSVGVPTIASVSVGAMVEVMDLGDNSQTRYFLLPAGGGESYEVDGEHVVVVSIASPIARAFMSKKIGDRAILRLPTVSKNFIITSIT